MANHKSAIKRHRQSLKRRGRNRDTRLNARTALKQTRVAFAEGDMDKAKKLLLEAERILAKAAQKRVLKKGTAARYISRLAKQISNSHKKGASAGTTAQAKPSKKGKTSSSKKAA